MVVLLERAGEGAGGLGYFVVLYFITSGVRMHIYLHSERFMRMHLYR